MRIKFFIVFKPGKRKKRFKIHIPSIISKPQRLILQLFHLFFQIIVAVNPDKFPLLAAYMERCQSNIEGYEEANEAGLEILRSLLTGVDLQLPSD